ncbi:MAG TPA: type IV pilus assembly protein PilM [Epulopiscium sp.]|nr:type IV pilus assembly protein PilM [Candidatus Epulonipiscium sp.]
MAQYILGLEIGNANIKLLECRKQGMQLMIEKSRIIPTPEGIVCDGIIMDSESIYNIINEEIKKGKYKSKDIVAVIKSSEIITRDIRMDEMPKKDMEAILALQYQEHLLVDIEAYQVTYKVVQKAQETQVEGQEQELLIVAAPNKIIYPLLDVATRLKMRMRSINIASDAITHLFLKESPITAINEHEIMVIDIGGTSTTVTIVSDGIGVLNRDIPFGLDAINPLMTREFGTKNTEAIETFKTQYAGIYEDEIEDEQYGQYISSVIKPMIQYQLVAEIQRFLQFHFSRGKNKAIEKIYMIGGGSYLKNIGKYVTDLLGIPCVSGIELNQTHIQGDAEFEKQSAYYINILGIVNEFWG